MGRPVAGRWDPGVFDVLYTCREKQGALTEVHYHLSLQPVFPSKVRFFANELKVRSDANLIIADVAELLRYGVAQDVFLTREYSRMQEIGDAAFFLGFDGLLVPSARGPFQNLVVFTERLGPDQIEKTREELIDWDSFRRPKH